MKKQKVLTFVLFIFCLCLTRMNALTVHAGEISEEYAIDDAMRTFMQENNLPESAVPIDCGLELIYRQTDEKYAGFSLDAPNDIMKDSYGFWANMVAYNSEAGIHLFFDIRFAGNAEVSENDVLKIMYPDGLTFRGHDGSFPAQGLSANDIGGWNVEVDFSAWMSDGSGIMVELDERVQTKEINRILLCINGTVADNFSSSLGKTTLTWEHRVSTTPSGGEAVLAPSTIYTLPVEDYNAFPWKAILIVLLIDLDLVAIFLIVRHVRKKRSAQNGTQPQRMSADGEIEAEAELQQNLKLKPEDIEYLKDIGYFDPNKK